PSTVQSAAIRCMSMPTFACTTSNDLKLANLLSRMIRAAMVNACVPDRPMFENMYFGTSADDAILCTAACASPVGVVINQHFQVFGGTRVLTLSYKTGQAAKRGLS